MKLNEFISNLLDIVNEKPELGGLEVVYASDDEGNSHHKVINSPTLVIADGFTNYSEVEILDDELTVHHSPNAIIIN